MSFGERAALEGVLTQLRPELAVEIGTAEGGSLERIAAYSRHVHSFDLVEPAAAATRLANVTFHRGSSHELLPPFLAELESEGANADFVLVDGDHTSDGVRRDVEDLLRSGAMGRSVMLIHDTMNETVRGGLEQVPYESLEKVAYVDLDFVPGYFVRGEPFRHELWGGPGLVVVEAEQHWSAGDSIRQHHFYEAFDLIRPMRDLIVSAESAAAPMLLESGWLIVSPARHGTNVHGLSSRHRD